MRVSLALFGGVVMALAIACSDDAMKVKRVHPNWASLRGDEDVRIEGEGFRTDIGYSVYFGTQKALSVMVEGPTALVATTPGVDDPQEVDVRIEADNGKTFLLKKAFRYLEPNVNPGDVYDQVSAKKHRARQHR